MTQPEPPKSNTLLVAFVLPDKGEWTEVEADDIADGFRDIINEEWERNGASRPGYYTPCEISAIPAPQWLTEQSLQDLRAAAGTSATPPELNATCCVAVEPEIVADPDDPLVFAIVCASCSADIGFVHNRTPDPCPNHTDEHGPWHSTECCYYDDYPGDGIPVEATP